MEVRSIELPLNESSMSQTLCLNARDAVVSKRDMVPVFRKLASSGLGNGLDMGW